MTKFKKAVLKQKIKDVIDMLNEYHGEIEVVYDCTEAIMILDKLLRYNFRDIED